MNDASQTSEPRFSQPTSFLQLFYSYNYSTPQFKAALSQAPTQSSAPKSLRLPSPTSFWTSDLPP